jgi:DNA segregation ATPase FtsK/SpoIIIE, S-DNA-T family
MNGTRPQRGGELIPFPQHAGTQVPPTPEVVVDGDLLTERHNTAAVLRTLAGLCTQMVMLARRLAASPKTAQAWAVVGYRLRKAPRDAVRLGWFFLRGHGRWISKGWMWATHGHLRADARAAWLAGDVEARRSAQELIRSNARVRWAKIGLAAHRVTTAALLVMLVGGVLALIDAHVARVDMWPWLAEVYTVLGITGVVLMWLLKVVPVGWLVAAIWEGRDRTPGAGWLVRPNRDDADSWMDERMISQALAHLGIAPLDRFFKKGASWSTPCP